MVAPVSNEVIAWSIVDWRGVMLGWRQSSGIGDRTGAAALALPALLASLVMEDELARWRTLGWTVMKRLHSLTWYEQFLPAFVDDLIDKLALDLAPMGMARTAAVVAKVSSVSICRSP